MMMKRIERQIEKETVFFYEKSKIRAMIIGIAIIIAVDP